MLVNRDSTSPHTVRVVFQDSQSKRNASFAGPVTSVSFGSEQYVWANDGPNSHPDRDHPPLATLLPRPPLTFTLPKASITVLRVSVPAIKYASSSLAPGAKPP